jgi:hypothetical protein
VDLLGCGVSIPPERLAGEVNIGQFGLGGVVTAAIPPMLRRPRISGNRQ